VSEIFDLSVGSNFETIDGDKVISIAGLDDGILLGKLVHPKHDLGQLTLIFIHEQ